MPGFFSPIRYTSLQVIIAHHFTYGKNKILLNIKESPNIMKMIVGIYRKTSKTIKQWNCTVEYPSVKNELSNGAVRLLLIIC